MDPEKNVIDAARKLTDAVYVEHFGSSYKRVRVDCLLVNELQAALSAYDAARKDSAPAASVYRVQEAAKKAIRGFVGNEVFCPSLRAIDDVAEAIRPSITPAPALPPGTVAVSVETLREGVAVLNRAYLGGINRGDDDVAKSHNALSKILPPPPRPEPSAGLVEEWKAAARAESDKAYDAKLAALRAAWEAEKGGA